MKKRITALVAATSAVAMLLTACQSGGISNEYVSLSEYKGIEFAKVEYVEVTAEDVEMEIASILETYADTVEITDRPAELGDIATIDYEGKKDGVAFDGGSAEGYGLELGSGTFIDGFEDGIVGHNIGETFDLNLTFPEDYHTADLAGQEVVFTVTLHSLSQVVTPELTEEFVTANFADYASSVEEYKAVVKEELEAMNEESYISELRNSAWTAVLELATVKEYPEGAVQEYVDILYSEYETYAEYYGMELVDFAETYLGMDEETFEAKVKEAGETQAKSDLVRDLLVENTDVDTSEEAYQASYEFYAEYYGFETVDEFLAEMKSADSLDYLNDLILLEMVQDWVIENGKQVEVTE